jgi:hypothetical protein
VCRDKYVPPDISCWAVGIFPVAQQEISRHAKSVGTFPIGVVGTFPVGCVGISTASVSGHFYRPHGQAVHQAVSKKRTKRDMAGG